MRGLGAKSSVRVVKPCVNRRSGAKEVWAKRLIVCWQPDRLTVVGNPLCLAKPIYTDLAYKTML